jgi:hypothetical protein
MFCHPEEPKATKDLINNTHLYDRKMLR